MDIGKAIEADRKHVGMSQDQLADAVGVSQQAVSYWEEGRSRPQKDRVHVLADLFGTGSHCAEYLRARHPGASDPTNSIALRSLTQARGALVQALREVDFALATINKR